MFLQLNHDRGTPAVFMHGFHCCPFLLIMQCNAMSCPPQDPRKFARAKELLAMNVELKEARKAFQDQE